MRSDYLKSKVVLKPNYVIGGNDGDPPNDDEKKKKKSSDESTWEELVELLKRVFQ